MLGWGVDRKAGTMQLLEELLAALSRRGAGDRVGESIGQTWSLPLRSLSQNTG